MARGKGTANLAASIEPLAGAPLDARDIVPTVADLYIASNWPYKYIGMKTTVTATGETYRLVNLDVTQQSSWVLDGASGQTIQVSTLPTAGADELGNVYQYIGATGSGIIHGHFYECVFDGTAYSWEETETDTPTRELTSAEMADVKSSFSPVVESIGGLPILFDEGSTERQVGWYRYANGTKQPVYEKTFFIDKTTMASIPNDNTVYSLVTSLSNVKRVILLQSYLLQYNTDLECVYDASLYTNKDDTLQARTWFRNFDKLGFSWIGFDPATRDYEMQITIRYTKTTDTPA